MIPKLRFKEFSDEWKSSTIGDEGSFYYGKSAPKWSVSEGSKTECVRYGELYSKYSGIVDNIHSKTNIDVKNLKLSKGGEVLVPRVGEDPLDFAKCSYLPFKDVAIGEMISVYNTENDGFFMSSYFRATCKYKFARVVEGGSVSNLYFRYLEPIKIFVPNKFEQIKIGSLISVLDKKINLFSKKKEALEAYKKGLMQKIFSQELRFKREDGSDFPKWEEVVYSEFLKERDNKHPQSDEFPLCSFVAHKGVVPKGDRYNREFLVSDKKGKKYKRTKKGDFIYSSNNLETGSIGLNEYGNGCISPVYSVFSIDKGCDINFIAHFLVTKANLHKMIRFRQGVMYGQWRIHETDFLKIKVAIPSNEEQKHIGEVLKSMNSGLEELERLISASSKLKKGLLQQMFV